MASPSEGRYTLPDRPESSLRKCRICDNCWPNSTRLWDRRMDMCARCAASSTRPGLRSPNHAAHPNPSPLQTRYCSLCSTRVPNNAHYWVPTAQSCRPCAWSRAAREGERRAQAEREREPSPVAGPSRHAEPVDAEFNSRSDPTIRIRPLRIPQQQDPDAGHSPSPSPPQQRHLDITRRNIPPPGIATGLRISIRRCALCSARCSSQNCIRVVNRQTGNEEARCRPCRNREQCRGCHRQRKWKRFVVEGANGLLPKTCVDCRDAQRDKRQRRADAADAAGLRFCRTGSHSVSLDRFISDDGIERRTCRDCLQRRRRQQPRADPVEEYDEGPPEEEHDGVQHAPVDEFDAIFGDGSDFAALQLPDDSAVNAEEAECLRKFDAALEQLQVSTCSICREEGFHISLGAGEICTRCKGDKNPVKLWSDANRVNPMPESQRPACLKNLTEIEEMLIARVKSVMQVRYTKGRQLQYKDHVVNFRQDISAVAERLPRLPDDLDLVIIRQAGTDVGAHVDFMVRRDRVRDALLYKIAHDPAYADLGAPDPEALNALPESGSIAHLIPTCTMGEDTVDHQAPQPAGPQQAAGPSEEDEDGGVIVGGVLDVGGHREEIVEVREQATAIADGASYDQTIIQAPALDASPLNENTPGYIAMAFPTLFPDGAGDFHQARQRPIHFGAYLEHLLRFEGGRFARHRRFPWFAFNTLQRQRTHSLAKVFVRQRHDARRMTAAELKAMLDEGDTRIANSMVRYGHTLRGTRAYWLARRNELDDMIRVKGAPHLFFTLSAADLQWPDLHQHMPSEIPVPANDDAAARRQRRLALERNPHLAASYLDLRVQALMKHVVHPLFNVRDYWYRYEWQERGSGHVHGFLWMKNAPDADQIDWTVLKDHAAVISEEQQEKMTAFVDFWKKIISATNPFPREDENIPLLGPHPCTKPRAEMKNTLEELSELLNWVERHSRCVPGYCQVKRKVPGETEPRLVCRFDFPMELRQEAGVGLDSKRRVRFEPARNDRLLNLHHRAGILAWRANIDLKPVLSMEAARSYLAKYASKGEKQAPAFPQLLSTVTAAMGETGTARLACQKLLNKMLGERTYSAQEIAHLLLGIPLVRSSASFQTLHLAEDGGMRGLEVHEDDATDSPEERTVTRESWIQRYMARPESLDALSMQELFTTHSWVKNEWRKRRDSTNIILRTFPRYSPDPAGDKYDAYCRTKILLHHPFRSLSDFDTENVSWATLFAQCAIDGHVHPKDTLRCWTAENKLSEEEDEEEDEDVPAQAQPMNQADWQVCAHLFPNAPVPQFAPAELGTRPIDDAWDVEAARGRWEDVELMREWLDEQKKAAGDNDSPDTPAPINLTTLADEQRAVLEFFNSLYAQILADQQPAQQLLQIDGSAGCGKTYLIHAICQSLREMAEDASVSNPIRVLAPSGVAALNILGQTIHSALGLPVNSDFRPLAGARLARLQGQWRGIKFLIIDEKSMLGLKVLGMIDARLRQLIPASSHLPFGGINVLLCGDFAQLPPVGDRPLYREATPGSDLSSDGAILYRLFARSFRLRVLHRQEGETPEQLRFKALLYCSSHGGLSIDDWNFLNTRAESVLSQQEKDTFKEAVGLYTLREDVETVNLAELEALKVPCARVEAEHDGGLNGRQLSAEEAGGLENYVYLARGAKVMVTRNLWSNKGLVNATVGTIEDVIWHPGASRSDVPMVILIACSGYTGPTRWKTANGTPIVPIPASKSTFEHAGKTMARIQIPLRLAWAVTVHKSQGLTLKKVKLGLGKREFANGLTFVALSRVKTIDSLIIVGQLDYARVQKLAGSNYDARLHDLSRRYPN